MSTKPKNKVYVVTRNSRRIEDRNYTDKSAAEKRASQLVRVLKKYRDPDVKRVKVVHTESPSRIR
ncbi:MAG: hypothetical protein GWP32_07460 [Bacteroidetes bacterium]|nr:hypothetical protein [Bacteroidota bacterium]